MHVLFVCSLNKIRSRTAQEVFKNYPGIEVLSAGTKSNSRIRVTASLLEWSDIIFVMETEHRDLLEHRYSEIIRKKKLVCLEIEDEYSYMDPDLVEILRREVSHNFDILLS